MKVFISWSGERSKVVAEALRSWIPDIIQAVKPWVSSLDIRAGARWSREVEEQLRDTQFGIICLTKENQTAPWFLFEAGALAKSVVGSYVCPYLIDLTPAQLLSGPFTLFQAKQASEEETRDLVRALNTAVAEAERLSEAQVTRAFDRWWPDLRQTLANLPAAATPVATRSSEDVADELLTSTRELRRLMAEALSLLSTARSPTLSNTIVHHVRVLGEPAKLDELLVELRHGAFGGRVAQFQRYSDTAAAANVASGGFDAPFDLTAVFQRAGALGVDVKVNLVPSL